MERKMRPGEARVSEGEKGGACRQEHQTIYQAFLCRKPSTTIPLFLFQCLSSCHLKLPGFVFTLLENTSSFHAFQVEVQFSIIISPDLPARSVIFHTIYMVNHMPDFWGTPFSWFPTRDFIPNSICNPVPVPDPFMLEHLRACSYLLLHPH